MLNTIFNCLTAKRNTSPVLAFQVTPKDKAIFDKYFTYYVNDGYSEDEAKLISDVLHSFPTRRSSDLMSMKTLISETCSPQTI